MKSKQSSLLLGNFALTSFLLFFSQTIQIPIQIQAQVPPKHQSFERPIQIKNESGKRTELYWIHPQSDELVLMTPAALVHGQTFALNSFVNHTFLVREVPDERTGGCDYVSGTGTVYEAPSLSPVCRSAYVTVNEHDDQVIHILKDMEIEVEDSDSHAQETSASILSQCHQQIQRKLQSSSSSSSTADALRAVDDFAACAHPSLTAQIESLHRQIQDQRLLRLDLAEPWEDYTCADFDLPTTSPKFTRTWRDRQVGVLLDRDEAKIHYVENFISPDECAAIEAAAQPSLHAATVADGAGGSHLQKSRKALQAGVRVPWEKEGQGDLIAAVSRRLYDYINDATGYGIETAGQEDLMSIQYFGRGLDDPAPDRYKPHCDGQCDGLQFQNAGRVATMVMYCEAPEKGGATNFRNVGVHVVPKKGDAAFFSYLGSDGKVDDRLTEHSCCPVLVGEKKIAVQWLRLGVDEENPWNSFNTLNVKIGSEED